MIKKTKDNPRRSDCPLACSLDLLGDKWSLLIIRDMMFSGKATYNEFLASPEKIATNILNDRLNKLVALGILSFSGPDKRKKYELTERGKDLQPVLEAMKNFGVKHFEGSKEYYEQRKKAITNHKKSTK